MRESREKLEEAKGVAEEAAREVLARSAPRLHIEKLALKERLRAHDAFFEALVAALLAAGRVRAVRGDSLEWVGLRPELTPEESRARERILAAYRAARLAPPGVEEAARSLGLEEEVTRALTVLLVEEGELVKAAEGLFFHREALDDARRRLRAHLEKVGSTTAAAAKEALGSTRKYMIPLLEHFDREGLTVRRGDLRELRPGP